MGPVTLTFRYNLRTLIGTLMLTPNPRRVKTGLDSAEYDMRQFKSGTQIDGKSLRLGREFWVQEYGSGFLWTSSS